MNIAVIGHIEWGTFLKVPRLPTVGESVYALESWQEVCGGGSVAAMQAASLNGTCTFFTAVGNDDIAKQAIKQLEKSGIVVYATTNEAQQTKSYIHIDDDSDRTITVVERFKPNGTDTTLPWEKLSEMDAVYFVSGDKQALLHARKAKIVISTTRVTKLLNETGVLIDVVVSSAKDNLETYKEGDIIPKPKAVVVTNGVHGGKINNGPTYQAEVVPSEKVVDFYGCGDSFAAGLTFGLGQDLSLNDAIKIAAHSGAQAAQRRGAFGN